VEAAERWRKSVYQVRGLGAVGPAARDAFGHAGVHVEPPETLLSRSWTSALSLI
jgi:hypothetical protein